MPSDPTHRPVPDLSIALAELSVITESIERQRERVASIAEPFVGTHRDDVVVAVHEAERQLLVATRGLRHAITTLSR